MDKSTMCVGIARPVFVEKHLRHAREPDGLGWQVFLKISDPFKRSILLSGRSAVVPFVP